MSQIKVAVLRGGPSSEHQISLLTGEAVLSNLDQRFLGIDVLVDKEGNFDFKKLLEVDVVFNALHGEFGEDGQIQQILERNKITYVGSDSISSKLAMDKFLTYQIFKLNRINFPLTYKVSQLNSNLPDFSLPWIVKPQSRGSSVGISLVKKISQYQSAINLARKYDQNVLVQKYLKGREISCGILENFKGQKYFALPPIEIIPPESKEFFDYYCKYDGSTKEICPARLDKKTIEMIKMTAIKAHRVLGCRDYSRVDLILADKIYVLEVNTLPGLTTESLLPKEAKAIGLEFKDLITHLINLALARKPRN